MRPERPLLGVASDHERFTAMFDELAPRVFAYARRHCERSAAQDVVSETFAVAWRRFADVPSEALPWLLTVARNVISTSRRGARRRDALFDSLAALERLAGPVAGPDQTVVERDMLLNALGELSAAEREALLLVAWDGLTNTDAAKVAQCSQRAFEVRLSRARARLARGAFTGSTVGGL